MRRNADMRKRIARRNPARRMGQDAGVKSPKKAAYALEGAWMLRSALSIQEKSVDNFARQAGQGA